MGGACQVWGEAAPRGGPASWRLGLARPSPPAQTGAALHPPLARARTRQEQLSLGVVNRLERLRDARLVHARKVAQAALLDGGARAALGLREASSGVVGAARGGVSERA